MKRLLLKSFSIIFMIFIRNKKNTSIKSFFNDETKKNDPDVFIVERIPEIQNEEKFLRREEDLPYHVQW